MNELMRVDFESQSMTGKSGKKYFIHSSMSAARYAEYQLYEKEMAYGFTVKGIFDELGKINASMDKMKFVDSAVRINNLQRGALKVMERQPTIMKICMLYINEESEDVGTITTSMIDAKIKDLEHYDMRDFFTLAMSVVSGLTEILKKLTQTVSEMPVMEGE